jgi:two-component system nitrogen regulation sensor histidine kinase NtrY
LGTDRRLKRRVQTVATMVLVLLAPALVLATWLALGPLNQGVSSPGLRIVLLADFAYILVVAALILARVLRLAAARRARSVGSRLHLRLSGVFAIIALAPAVSVAVFAGLTINVGLEGWFSDRVRQVVGNSLAAAEAYEAEQVRGLRLDAEALATFIVAAGRPMFLTDDGELRQILSAGQVQVQRGLREAFIIDGAGRIRARGERSYLFDFDEPDAEALERAATGETVIIKDWGQDEFRALLRLPEFADRFLYVSREVDGAILQLLDETQETIRLYNQLERERGRILFEFGVLYIGFALILILAAVWLGLWFAERLSRPIGRLAVAAERVGQGDFAVQVPDERDDDEIGTLGRSFNQMTRQLAAQRAELLETNRQIEDRRRLFDSVLSSVSPGVIGLDAEGRVEFLNPSALRLLGLGDQDALGRNLGAVAPEFAGLFARIAAGGAGTAQEELRVSRGGRLETLLVRMSTRPGAPGEPPEGYVVAFDDVSDLVSAQRLAAWGDVARRIAHEIKNPLTPIQLSAERIRRKFAPLVGDEAAALESHTDVIVRQTADLRRIVDEFSRFARMPEPDRRSTDVVKLVRDSLLLQEAGQPSVRLVADLPEAPLALEVDATMLGQALTNLIKNAGEATESLVEMGAPEGYVPEVRVALSAGPDVVTITVADNGIGLPEDRARLFEPYVTTREKGTGLGLPIVKKIIEEHGGTLRLLDAPPFAPGAHAGALAEIRLPLLTAAVAPLRKTARAGREAAS